VNKVDRYWCVDGSEQQLTVLDEGMAGKPRFGSGPKPIQKANIHTHISS